ncbi:MAG: TlpA disulfide reductase family protein [Gammaproteobacteria bacterium]|jgi:peroxiredoxin
MRKTLIVTIAAVAVALPALAGELAGVAPDFRLQRRGGGEVSLADLRGDVVMINFWATWCGPCREEMPHLEALHQRYSDLGFTLIGINVEQDSRLSDQFLAETPVTFDILFDPGNRVSELYDVIAMPSTVLVDREGNLRYIHHGYKAGYENEYQSQVRALLRE